MMVMIDQQMMMMILQFAPVSRFAKERETDFQLWKFLFWIIPSQNPGYLNIPGCKNSLPGCKN